MLKSPVVLYLGSRGVAAAGNLLAVAIFTRIAGPAEYGHYLLIFAWSMIVYGFATQWMRFAYFGVHETMGDRQFIGSLASLVAFALLLLAGGFSVAALMGEFDPLFLGAVFALICGMTVFEAASEVARTLLKAPAVALSMVLRPCLTVALGSASLWWTHDAKALALAMALAHLIAAIPCLAAASDIRLSSGTRASALRILQFGWPLMLSFGVTAVGQSIDRLLLAHYAGPVALGPYGVLADLLRQTFSVVGESIILAFVTIAKKHANEGDPEACTRMLRKAFNACFAASVFGGAFFFVFGEIVVRVLLGPQFVGPSAELIPIFTIAFAFITLRNFYFAQVIYFTHASFLELVISLVFVAVSSTLSILLIPKHGAHGAALSLMAASIVSCIGFMLLGRRYYKLPIDLSGFVTITALAAVFLLGSQIVRSAGMRPGLVLAIETLLFIVCAGLVVRRFRLLQAGSASDAAREQDAMPVAAAGKAAVAPHQPAHDEFLGLAFCRLPLGETVRAILDRADAGFAYVVTPNAPHVVTVHHDPERLFPVYRGAWLSLCDSQVLRRLAFLRGLSLPLVTGSDLVSALLDAQNTPTPRGGRKRVLVFGPDESIEAALYKRYPRADIAVLSGPKGLGGSAQLRADAARACLAREWDILLLCVGCPAQELIADQLRQQGCRHGVALCVGASIDFIVGRSVRAPRIFSTLGLEWAFRLALEPRRLWRRYLIEAPQILRIFFRQPSARS